MGSDSPFRFEIALYTLIGSMIEFFQSMLDKSKWVMSPSRFYLAIYETISWARDRNLWHFTQPAFLYVMEQCEKRAKSLQGTHDDESRAMEMGVWRKRRPPIPGGVKSILQIFDWFLPILRSMESKMVQYFGNPDTTATGHEFTKYEALDTVFNTVDKLYKDSHFGGCNDWGWQEAYPWVKFVRDEMYQWREALKADLPVPGPGGDEPWSWG